MNESDLADRLNALEAVFQGRDLAHQQCVLALLVAVDFRTKPIVSGLLGTLAAEARLRLPAPAVRYFDAALEEAQAHLRAT